VEEMHVAVTILALVACFCIAATDGFMALTVGQSISRSRTTGGLHSKNKGKKRKTSSKSVSSKEKGSNDGFLSKVAAGLAALVLSVGATFFGGGGGGQQQAPSPKEQSASSLVSVFTDMGTFRTIRDIPKSYFKENKIVYGQVVKVVDGDTVRIRHQPTPFSSAEFSGNLKDETIMVRIAAVDSPETAKFGQEGQPFGEEAKQFATKAVLGKRVRVKALAKDRYDRLLGTVRYDDGIAGERDLSEELLRRGLAVVYRQGGAQYDGRKSEFEGLEREAKQARRGLWSQKGGGESPAEYKARNNKQQKSKQKADARS
jgi:endonuclease YncB( thermonuclease family)